MGEEAMLPTSSSGGEWMLPLATWARVHALARHGRSIRGIGSSTFSSALNES